MQKYPIPGDGLDICNFKFRHARITFDTGVTAYTIAQPGRYNVSIGVHRQLYQGGCDTILFFCERGDGKQAVLAIDTDRDPSGYCSLLDPDESNNTNSVYDNYNTVKLPKYILDFCRDIAFGYLYTINGL